MESMHGRWLQYSLTTPYKLIEANTHSFTDFGNRSLFCNVLIFVQPQLHLDTTGQCGMDLFTPTDISLLENLLSHSKSIEFTSCFQPYLVMQGLWLAPVSSSKFAWASGAPQPMSSSTYWSFPQGVPTPGRPRLTTEVL